MKPIDEIVVFHQGIRRSVKLFIGDLANIPAGEAVDLLVVSAFPNDYSPTMTSLIGALDRRGVSVRELATSKAVDLRQFSSCWLSMEIQQPNIHFRRILCFEPRTRGRAPEVVGDIFRSVIPFTTGSPPIARIAMPIVASGDQGEPRPLMLEAVLRAAVHWLSVGLPVECIAIVDRTAELEPAYREVFATVRKSLPPPPEAMGSQGWRYDLFVSYSRDNKEDVDHLIGEIMKAQSHLRVFVDLMELQAGSAWQQHLFEVLDECRKVVAVFSPDYLASKVCKEEFNIALFRHRESPEGVLLPVYLRSAELPTYMKLIQYEDAREGDPEKIAVAGRKIASRLAGVVA